MLTASLALGCEGESKVIPEELTRGFWMEDDTNSLLLTFEDDGSVCNYIYREHPAENIYYACPDPEWEQYDRYLIDVENNMLFVLPDRWYNITRMNDSFMELKNDEATLTFNKMHQGEDIVVVDYDRFIEIFPDYAE